MSYDKNYYQGKRQKIQEKFQKAQGKYFQMCEMAGKEYISLQERIIELNTELQELQKQEEESKSPQKGEKDGKTTATDNPKIEPKGEGGKVVASETSGK